jgi:hypothetical protein
MPKGSKEVETRKADILDELYALAETDEEATFLKMIAQLEKHGENVTVSEMEFAIAPHKMSHPEASIASSMAAGEHEVGIHTDADDDDADVDAESMDADAATQESADWGSRRRRRRTRRRRCCSEESDGQRRRGKESEARRRNCWFDWWNVHDMYQHRRRDSHCEDKVYDSTNAKPGVGPKILYAGNIEMSTKIKSLPGKFASEILMNYDVKKNGMKVNTTHLTIPMNHRLQAKYIKLSHGADDKEVGVAVQRFTETSMKIMSSSGIADDITVAVAEKMHAYTKKNLFDNAVIDRVTSPEKKDDDSSWWDWWGDFKDSVEKHFGGKDHPWMRNLLTTALGIGSKPIMNLWTVAGGPNAATRDWASDGGAVPEYMLKNAENLLSDMSNSFKDLVDNQQNFEDPLLSSLNCFHFGAGVTLDIDNEEIHFPLDKKLSTYRAHTTAAPFLQMEVWQGTGSWSYQKELETVTVYFGTSLEVSLNDAYVANPTGAIYVSAKDGVGDAVTLPPWNNQQKYLVSEVLDHVTYLRDFRYKPDYEFLFKDPASVCPESQYSKIEENLQKFDDVHGGMTLTDTGYLVFNGGLLPLLESAKNAMEIIPCLTQFLKPDHVNSTEYSIYMSLAGLHGLMEIPRRYVMSTLGARDWNVIDVSLINGN